MAVAVAVVMAVGVVGTVTVRPGRRCTPVPHSHVAVVVAELPVATVVLMERGGPVAATSTTTNSSNSITHMQVGWAPTWTPTPTAATRNLGVDAAVPTVVVVAVAAAVVVVVEQLPHPQPLCPEVRGVQKTR